MLLFFALLLPISMVAMEQNNGVFSFKLQDVTVKDIFKYIEKNSEYIFLYSTDKNLLKKINVDVSLTFGNPSRKYCLRRIALNAGRVKKAPFFPLM